MKTLWILGNSAMEPILSLCERGEVDFSDEQFMSDIVGDVVINYCESLQCMIRHCRYQARCFARCPLR